MGRGALSPDTIVDLALGLIDEGGPAALTLSAVAGAAGVAPPSLYKHVRNLAELRALVSARVLTEIAEQVGEAVLGRSGDEAVRALMTAWRAYVRRHPNRYAVLIHAPEPQSAEAGARLLTIASAALRAYGMKDSAAIHAIRCLRAAVHGFAVLEAEGGFGLPEDLNESYDLLIHMVIAGLHASAAPGTKGLP
ncbi:TetR family transcriptional regulator [[Actinomadura] parvosata subsp. kistnae]|uniref:TetR family transcriptional regulator n=1 Tax=[Actinomadura] parvosata subsp. kistnae TaxID=1909395 RepID=A0A1U9ZUG0_9ACTN|nr:TetR-like C-terminal domain-containing protein [Nonomuraea sp. ATCC 55076]AQZ61585.1 TetR family transcriptional regulator [Nonomuraea sp. ATCC 55076]